MTGRPTTVLRREEGVSVETPSSGGGEFDERRDGTGWEEGLLDGSQQADGFDPPPGRVGALDLRKSSGRDQTTLTAAGVGIRLEWQLP